MKTQVKITSSHSFLVRRRLMKRRVKAAVFRAALKKKKKLELEPELGASGDGVTEEGSFLECAFGFCMNGEFVQLTRGFLVNSAAGLPPYYLPVVDNHGFLLGEFRKLDEYDLNFVQEEEEEICQVSYTSFLTSGLNWGAF